MGRIKERRRRQRIDVALPIEIVYNKEKIFARTKNISVLGTYLWAEKEVPRDVILDIRIKVPEKGPGQTRKIRKIGCVGVAFRCQATAATEPDKRYGIGIFFRSFLKEGEKDLADYIDYILLQEKKTGKIFMRKRKQRKRIYRGR